MENTLNTPASQEEAGVEKVENTTASKKEKPVKIKFLISPTGKFNLAYNAGEKAALPKLQADELIEAGFAELVK